MFSNSINLKRCNDKIENRKTYNVHVQFILISDLYMAFFRIADQIMLHIIFVKTFPAFLKNAPIPTGSKHKSKNTLKENLKILFIEIIIDRF